MPYKFTIVTKTRKFRRQPLNTQLFMDLIAYRREFPNAVVEDYIRESINDSDRIREVWLKTEEIL